MLTIYDDATLATALQQIADARLTEHIDRIAHDAKASSLWGLTCILVMEPEDHAAALEPVLGFDPLVGPLQDIGEPFIAYWSWLERHDDQFEMLLTVGDEGFAYFVLVPDDDASLLAKVLRRHTGNLES